MKNTEVIVDDIGITISVDYDYEIVPPEDYAGGKTIGGRLYSDNITAVNLCIDGGRNINILPLLHPNEIEIIQSNLKYEL